jgi:hypothetical protein
VHGLFEDGRQVVERLGEVGLAAELARRSAERLGRGASRSCREAAGVGDGRVPSGAGQQQPGRLIDERVDDHPRQLLWGEPRAGDTDHRRHDGRQLRDRRGQVGAQRPPAGDPPAEPGVGEVGQYTSGGDGAHRHGVRRPEPADRRTDVVAQRIELPERGQ